MPNMFESKFNIPPDIEAPAGYDTSVANSNAKPGI
jgi:hypothetical protein